MDFESVGYDTVNKEPSPPLTDAGWAAFLASGLVMIEDVDTLAEARAIAKERLTVLIDPVEGIGEIPYEVRLRWYVAAHSKETP